MPIHAFVDESIRKDRYILCAALIPAGNVASADLHYSHVVPHNEPALWWPDAIAWAFGAGGAWTERATPVVRLHRHVRAG